MHWDKNSFSSFRRQIAASSFFFPRCENQRMSKIMETQDINYQSLSQINEAVGRRSLAHNLPGSWFLALPLQRPERKTVTLNKLISDRDRSNFLSFGLATGIIFPTLLAGAAMPLSLVRKNGKHTKEEGKSGVGLDVGEERVQSIKSNTSLHPWRFLMINMSTNQGGC